MKSLITLLLIAFALPVAADAPDKAAIAVFESVASAWSSGNAKAIGAHLDKDTKVSLNLDDSGSYSRDQAIAKLDEYLDSNPTVSLELLEKDGYEGGNNPSATYEYEYKDADGKKRKAQLLVSLRKKGDRWIVAGISRM
ncbi:MAG: DUF4783 domain-containing protein [Planctomycetota bacterium]